MSLTRRVRLLAIGVLIGGVATLNWAVGEIEHCCPEFRRPRR